MTKIPDDFYLTARNLSDSKTGELRAVIVYVGDIEIPDDNLLMLWVFESADGSDRGVVNGAEVASLYDRTGLTAGSMNNQKRRI